MAYRALTEAGLPFHLLTAQDVRAGALDECKGIFVPGGWASNKLQTLGETGVARVRQFVDGGGTYVGFCGGAGLATGESLGLVKIVRVPSARRVPSFSGRIRLTPQPHPLWNGIDDPVFHAWWPSQFEIGEGVTVLARYGQALPDAFSSDLNVGDISQTGGWAEWETSYGINLDPARMLDLPALVAGRYGHGDVFLSLVHFDTPGDANGAAALKNLWVLISDRHGFRTPVERIPAEQLPGTTPLGKVRPSLAGLVNELSEATDGLIQLGRRSFLWFDREPSMLQWKRGVRGLEYYTLKVMVDEIRSLIQVDNCLVPHSAAANPLEELELVADSTESRLKSIKIGLLPFIEEARTLLILERRAMMDHKLTYAEAKDPQILALRQRLFSTKKSHGGLFKGVIDQLDALLYSLVNQTRS